MSRLDDFIDEASKEYVKEPLPPDPIDEYKQKLKEFFFGKKTGNEAGLCPKCGQAGRVHLSTFVCSEHGPY